MTLTSEIDTDGHILSLHDALPMSATAATSASVAAGGSVGRSRTIVLTYRFPAGDAHARPCRPRPALWRSARSHSPSAAPSRASAIRSEEHTSELQSLMRISYAVFCLQKQQQTN